MPFVRKGIKLEMQLGVESGQIHWEHSDHLVNKIYLVGEW